VEEKEEILRRKDDSNGRSMVFNSGKPSSNTFNVGAPTFWGFNNLPCSWD
jgi:hypothetical protein